VAPVADLIDLCRAAIGGARAGEEAEAFAEETRRTTVRAREAEVDSFSSSQSRGLGVRVVLNGRLGYAWAADPGAEEAASLLDAARENAAFATPDEAVGLPEAAEAEPLDGLFREAQAGVEPERKVSLALEMERAATSAEPSVRRVEEAIYGDASSRVAVASSAGLATEYDSTDCWCMVLALAERDGETQTGHSFRMAREVGELDWEEGAREAAQRGARMLGAVKPSTERLPVILDPWAAASFLGVLVGSLSAEQVQKGRSLLADRVGEEVASGLLSLVDDGRRSDAPGAAPFDDEGVPTRKTVAVERGVLRGFLHNTETARREGVASTGNARRSSYRSVPGVSPSNLFVEPGHATPEELLARAGRAVYVQEVTGVHSGANPVSGEFSVGATGLRTEGGALGEPLREMTIASTLLDMLKAVTAVGSDIRFFPGGGAIGTPTLLVGEMTVAGR
jgi:PmbA protein